MKQPARSRAGKNTILGADDVTGLVEILEAVRHLQEEKIPYRDIEVIFPIAEELYIKGTDAFDFSQVKAKEAYVLDMGGAREQQPFGHHPSFPLP